MKQRPSTQQELPTFTSITADQIVAKIEHTIATCRQQIDHLVAEMEDPTWDTFCQPLEEIEDRLQRIWSPIKHLYSVKNDPTWRMPYNKALQLLTDHYVWLEQHLEVYRAYCHLHASPHFSTLTAAQKKAVENALRDFRLSGVALAPEKKERYAEITRELTALSTHFANNVLDATMGWHQLITDPKQLSGLPQQVLLTAEAYAKSHNQIGWRLTLDMPSYLAVMTYCDQRALRYELYHAYTTRASEVGPYAKKWDNTPLIERTLALRHESAQLLGFANYAEYSLATKMAENPQQVFDFLTDLAQRARPQGERELAQLCQFARDQFNVNLLEPWDLLYYSEKQKQILYALDQEQLRAYFPLPRVLNGLFEIMRRLFGLTVQEHYNVDVWHPEVRYFSFYDRKGTQLGGFYLDLYVRDHKQGGAWMYECITARRDSNGTRHLPITYITCNFNRPVGGQPALLTHEEITTLFHECGHGLHHLLTQVEIASLSGMHGIPWDAIEFPSQFLEYWCWQPEALPLISGHYQTEEPLPKVLLERLLAAQHFQAAFHILHQLERSLFDMQLHTHYHAKKPKAVMEVLKEVKAQVAVLTTPDWLRTPHTFTHIFSGSYAAGYYSYFWAEVLAADAFSRFEEEGIFNQQVGEAFAATILAQGGKIDPLVLFKRFRGRAPSLEPFLRHKGIVDTHK